MITLSDIISVTLAAEEEDLSRQNNQTASETSTAATMLPGQQPIHLPGMWPNMFIMYQPSQSYTKKLNSKLLKASIAYNLGIR